MHKLYELKDMLCEELEEYGSKEKLDVGGLEIVDKLAHAIKNLDKIIEKYEEEEMGGSSYEGGESGQSRRGGSYRRGGSSYRGSSYRGGSSYRRGSSARGRGSSYAQRRDSMGRYSRDEGMVMELRELMEDAPDEQTRMEFEKFISKIEGM